MGETGVTGPVGKNSSQITSLLNSTTNEYSLPTTRAFISQCS